LAQVFGSCTISAQSQTSQGLISGANPAQPAFLEYDSCLVNASFVDIAGNSLVPASLEYRIDDIVSGTQILTWTTLTPAAVVQIIATSAQNALISNSLCHETHQVLVKLTDPAGNGPFYARCLFDLLRIPGVS
jgi:hypothetical protein